MNKLLLILLLIIVNSCAPGEALKYELELNFKVMANGEEVDINTPSNHTNSLGQTYDISKFQMLISDVFLSATGTSSFLPKHSEEEIPVDDKRIAELHFFDISDTSTHTLTSNLEERYGYLNFRFGLRNQDNNFEYVPDEFPYNTFGWGVDKFHYMKFEGNENVTSGSFNLHAGPTNGNDYSFNVSLPIRKSIDNDKLVLTVIIDVNEFFSNDFNFPKPMIMNSTDAQEKIKINGPDVFTLE